VVEQAFNRKADDYILHLVLYAVGFLKPDPAIMADQNQWFVAHPESSHFVFSLESDTAAFGGHLSRARELTRQAVDAAIQADSKESAGVWWQNAALREAAFGNIAEARADIAEGLKLAPNSESVDVQAALASAMSGDNQAAAAAIATLNKRFPENTQMQALWLPAVRAQVALNGKNASEAIDDLHAALPPIEYGQMSWVTNLSCLYPTWIRGQAYLAAGQGTQAAAEFQKILDHSGVVWNCWTGALAHLGLARAEALKSRTLSGADADAARVQALAAYKDFLTLWKDADPNIPIYQQARAEYAKLQ